MERFDFFMERFFVHHGADVCLTAAASVRSSITPPS